MSAQVHGNCAVTGFLERLDHKLPGIKVAAHAVEEEEGGLVC